MHFRRRLMISFLRRGFVAVTVLIILFSLIRYYNSENDNEATFPAIVDPDKLEKQEIIPHLQQIIPPEQSQQQQQQQSKNTVKKDKTDFNMIMDELNLPPSTTIKPIENVPLTETPPAKDLLFVNKNNNNKKEIQLPSKVVDGKIMPILRYSIKLPIKKPQIESLLENPSIISDKEINVNKTMTMLRAMPPNFDENSGVCQCGRISEACKCCIRAQVKEILFDHSICVNFTYLPAQQALKVVILLDNNSAFAVQKDSSPIASNDNQNSSSDSSSNKNSSSSSNNKNNSNSQVLPIIQSPTVDSQEILLLVSNPPMTCVGEAVSVCVIFNRVEYQIRPADVHKTRLQGCLDISVQLNNKNIAFYPAGCFTAQTKTSGGDLPLVQVPA